MTDYVTKEGYGVHLTENLDAANKCITDLPTLPDYVNSQNRPFICLAFVLGRCSYRFCSFQKGKHITKEKMPDGFAEKVVSLLANGVATCIRAEGGSLGKKVKFEAAY